jgi:hypothetical protein
MTGEVKIDAVLSALTVLSLTEHLLRMRSNHALAYAEILCQREKKQPSAVPSLARLRIKRERHRLTLSVVSLMLHNEIHPV